MRSVSVIAILCLVAVQQVRASGVLILDNPQDDLATRVQAEKTRKDLEIPRATYDQIVKQLWSYQQIDVDRLLGIQTSQPPSAVRPIFAPHGIGLPGILQETAHHGFYPMGDIAFVAFYFFDEEHVANAVLYFRADDAFVPLRSAADIDKRLQWDLRRLKQVQQWLHDHPPSTKPSRPEQHAGA
jgi:hypothetical protein